MLYEWIFDEITSDEHGIHSFYFSSGNEGGGNLTDFLDLLHECFTETDPTAVVIVNYAETCSKMRPGEFGGGAAVVSGQGVVFLHGQSLAAAKAEEVRVQIAGKKLDLVGIGQQSALQSAAVRALADLLGIMPEFEPNGDREHPGWETLYDLALALRQEGVDIRDYDDEIREMELFV